MSGSRKVASVILAILGSLGGVAVFAAAVWGVIRAILRWVSATEENTSVTKENTKAIKDLDSRVDILTTQQAMQGQTISSQGNEIDRLRNIINGKGSR
jgi:sensor domain CHASE-containing protein